MGTEEEELMTAANTSFLQVSSSPLTFDTEFMEDIIVGSAIFMLQKTICSRPLVHQLVHYASSEHSAASALYTRIDEGY